MLVCHFSKSLIIMNQSALKAGCDAKYNELTEIDACREAFLGYDQECSGFIDMWEMKRILENIGQTPSDEEVFQLISLVDEKMTGSIDFAGFLRVIEIQKEREAQLQNESDTIDAFVACGGNSDKSGHVEKDILVKIIKHDFRLPIDIEALINEIDTDGSGEIEYDEFKELMSYNR